jgi:hypothetical protein
MSKKITNKNPIMKGKKIEYNRGYYKDEKYSWICLNCGLVWLSRTQAFTCKERNHKKSYMKGKKIEKAITKIPIGKLIWLRLSKNLKVEDYFKDGKNPIVRTKEGNISWKESTLNYIKITGKELKKYRTKEGNISWKKTFLNTFLIKLKEA